MATKQNKREEGSRKVFKTKPVVMGEMRSVRIDNKTTIYIKAGDDVEEAKKLYKERQQSILNKDKEE